MLHAFVALGAFLLFLVSVWAGGGAPVPAAKATAKKLQFAVRKFEERRAETRSHEDYAAIFTAEQKSGAPKLHYVPLSDIFPAQVRYSLSNTLQKVEKYQAIKASQPNGVLPHNNGTSVLSPDDKERVIVGPDQRLYLLDGHHSAMACIAVGCNTMPVELVDNLSQLEAAVFWQVLANSQRAFLKAIDGSQHIPGSWLELEDDPFRYIAKMLCGKVVSKEGVFIRYEGALFPAWLKENDGVPFIEFALGDLLRSSHLQQALGKEVPESLSSNERLLDIARRFFLRLRTKDEHGQKIIEKIIVPERHMTGEEAAKVYFPTLKPVPTVVPPRASKKQ